MRVWSLSAASHLFLSDTLETRRKTGEQAWTSSPVVFVADYKSAQQAIGFMAPRGRDPKMHPHSPTETSRTAELFPRCRFL